MVLYYDVKEFLDVLACFGVAHGRLQSTHRLGTSLATVCVHEEGQSDRTYDEIRENFALRFSKAAVADTDLYKLEKKKRHSCLVLCCMSNDVEDCASTRISGPR